MGKAYLLVICLLFASFTGCIEDPALEPAEKVDEIKEESDNTEEKTSKIEFYNLNVKKYRKDNFKLVNGYVKFR